MANAYTKNTKIMQTATVIWWHSEPLSQRVQRRKSKESESFAGFQHRNSSNLPGSHAVGAFTSPGARRILLKIVKKQSPWPPAFGSPFSLQPTLQAPTVVFPSSGLQDSPVPYRLSYNDALENLVCEIRTYIHWNHFPKRELQQSHVSPTVQ